MKNIDAATLSEMTISMLERTAMVLAEPAPDSQPLPQLTRFARISYRGPSQGTLVLGATDGFLRELAASLLGIETDDVNVDTFGGDALKEMANIVGGSMILALSGEICEYSLGLPELTSSSEFTKGALPTPRVQCSVAAEGGVLSIRWYDQSIAKAA